MHSVRLDKLILAVSAAAATSLTCGHETEVVPVDWDAELPYWDPCGQFKTLETCPLGVMGPSCHWEKELEPGKPDTVWDIGCMSTQCGSDEDCNPEQECRAFNVAVGWPGPDGNQFGDYAPSHYCWPLWPDEVRP